jgi:hypothetical protein
MEKKKEYNRPYLLAKVRTTREKASDRLRQRANKRNKKRVGRLPTSKQKWKIIVSDEVRCRIGKGLGLGTSGPEGLKPIYYSILYPESTTDSKMTYRILTGLQILL